MSTSQALEFVNLIVEKGVRMCAGVPDSLLGALSLELDKNELIRHVKAPHEGLALSTAAGFQLATRDRALVYLQNSGLGNLVNPYLSLMHERVYDLPILMMIGWRGEDPEADEPQHRAQGQKTLQMLHSMDIEIVKLDSETDMTSAVNQAIRILDQGRSVAILASKGTMGAASISAGDSLKPERKEWLREIQSAICHDSVVVSTTGKTSRELFELQSEQERKRTFYCIGGMGHVSSIATGFALGKPETKVVCIDGDGALQMHAGSLFMVGASKPRNLIHVLINNGVHESVGGQDVSNPTIDYVALSLLAGYATAKELDTIEDLQREISSMQKAPGPHFLVCQTSPYSSGNLGRPVGSPKEWVNDFISTIISDD